MILSYETIISRIIAATSLPKIEIEAKIDQKLKELQDLISKEGAAHIVANELNVKLFDSAPKSLQIKDLAQGLNSINLLARVLTINEIRSYKKNNREGRIASLLSGDETGTVRVVVWDEKLIEEFKNIKEGDIIKIVNAYSKENNGYKELHLGSKSVLLINPPNETIGEVKITVMSKKKDIKDIKENEFVEIHAFVVQIFEPKSYNACPVCNKKVVEQDSKFVCAEHGNVQAKKIPIINIFVDDGTGNIRAVLFRDLAEKLIGKDNTNFEAIKKEILGKQCAFKGKVNKNQLFDRTELIVNSIEDLDPAKLAEQLEKEINI